VPTELLTPIPSDRDYLRFQRIERDMFGPRCLLQSSWVGVKEAGDVYGGVPLHYDHRLLPCARPKKRDTALGNRKRSDYDIENAPGGFVWTPKI
jgi:hypothetical protein